MKFFSTLSKHIFFPRNHPFRKFFSPLATLIFLYLTLILVYELSLSKNDLIHKKTIVKDKVVVKSNKEKEIRYYTTLSQNYFRVSSPFYSKEIENEIIYYDTIDIFYRTEKMAFWGMGRQFDIYELHCKQKIFFTIDDVKRYNKGMLIIVIIGTLFFGVLLIRTKY